MILKSVKYREKEALMNKAIITAKPISKIDTFSGSSPTPFIGQYGYPRVNVGIMSPIEHQEQAWEYDAPRYWAKKGKQIADIVGYRTQLVNSRFQSDIKKTERLVGLAQEVAMAKKSVDIEVALKEKPKVNFKPSDMITPLGPQAELNKIKITCNPRIPTRVQKYYDDKDMLSAEALITLHKHGIDESWLSKMLSTATFGKNRRLVPTRWSITATDDTLGKDQMSRIREAPTLNDHELYYGEYMGNHYYIMLTPAPWNYELFEIYARPGPALEYSTDHEEHTGRKNYAEQCAGGYYTVRLAVTESLKHRNRQASTLAVRFITDDYLVPLGVWVTREAARKAMQNKPIRFGSQELMLTYLKHLAKKKFGMDISGLLRKRKNKEKQKTLGQY